MSRRKKRTPPGPQTVDYFAELRKAFPDDVPVTCPGCDTPGAEHKVWCRATQPERPDDGG